ncbi:RagB/SusD family nutrient uptake outer membrane protein [Pedobacter glucosidilyticus]|uniref:RagB/SusD family nutrient uptake outer membrane protein n=1 Tax=Pedobacter glucosidilyticus TaxID=1122941 RepID=UPI0026F1E1EC|nr:RagB/SusD family nutrient uptake outer membrane protein [Pedobacter glucosidilyticus]
MKRLFEHKYTKYLVLVLTCFVFDACKKFDLPPNDELSSGVVNQSTANLDGIINSGYGRLIAQGPPTVNSSSVFDMALYAEAMGATRTVFPSPQSGANAATNLMYNFSMQPDNVFLARLSRNLYVPIASANSTLFYINNTPPADSEFSRQKDRLMGEAYFIRGLCFFYAARFWAHQYGHNTNTSGGGILLPLEPSIDGSVGVKRATIEETYDQIISDLQQAAALLPVAYDANIHGAFPAYRFRANKAAALAVLARVYFQQATPASYQLAKETIDKVIGNTPGTITGTPETGNRVYSLQNDITLPFNSTGFTAPPANSEEILRLVNSTTATAGYTNASINITNESGGNPQSRGAARWFLNRPTPNPPSNTAVTTSPLFDDVVNDRRFTQLTFNNAFAGAIGNQRLTQKWGFQTQATLIGMQTFPLIRAAELVITRAEINAVQGNTALALDDYNLIRRRAITGYVNRTLLDPAIGGTQAGLIAEIVRERQRELLFEGFDFWSWKRMAAYNAANGAIYPASQVAPLTRGTQTFEWNSNRTLLKFHVDDLTLNFQVGLEAQNPN